jgi:hypothetical protein
MMLDGRATSFDRVGTGDWGLKSVLEFACLSAHVGRD